MAYVTQDDLAGYLPPDFLLEALDDDADGVEDAGLWALLVAAVEDEIDSILGQRYTVPFSSPPAVVTHSARLLALEALYQRRGVHGDANPWASRAQAQREKLDRIATGEEPLTPDTGRTKPSVSVVSESSRLQSANSHFYS